MAHFFQFVTAHWVLWTAFLIVVILIILEETRGSLAVGGAQRVSASQVVDMMNHQNAVVVDLRDNEAYAQGHIVNAMSLPYEQLESKIKKLNKYKKRPIILLAESSKQLMDAAKKLREQGFESLYSLTGGMQEWKNDGYPLVKGKTKKRGKSS